MKKIIFILSLLAYVACSEIISVDINSASKAIVIYGYVTSDEQIQRLEVSTSVDYLDTTTDPAIVGAKVTVNGYEYSDDPDSAGVYLSNVAFKAEQGVDYTITVNYDFDEDGTQETYTAQAQLADTCCIIGGHLIESKLMGFSYYTPYLTSAGLSGDEYWYVYFSLGDSLLVENLDDISIMDASSLVGSQPTDSIPFMDMMNFRAMYFSKENQAEIEKMFDSTSTTQPVFLGVGDTIKISVCTIDKGFYDFLTTLEKSTGSTNPIFGSGAVFLPSNFSNDAIGYFGSLNQKHINLIVQ